MPCNHTRKFVIGFGVVLSLVNHDTLAAQLIGRWPESRPQPSLARITALCDLLGRPQDACPVIQVTGTNGKGSTAIMIDSLLRAMGLRTGRFSSPHLVDVTERISIDGEPISVERFDNIWSEIAPFVEMVDEQLIDGVKMTFFEVITAMAYAAFADAPVDVAVMEVGMGGLWDATSVAKSQVGVVSPIALDHTHILGSTIAEIANEKAWVIKPGGVGVMAGQTPEAAEVLTRHCLEVGAKMVREGVDFGLLDRQIGVGGQVVRIQGTGGPVGGLFLPLFGEHMAHNCALAIGAVESFLGGRALEPSIIEEGLANVKAPARLEIVHSDPTVVLDTAHNPHAITSTLAGLKEVFPGYRVIVVSAMMRDKAVNEVIEKLVENADAYLATTIPGLDRALSCTELAQIAESVFGSNRVQQYQDPNEALQVAMSMADAPQSDTLVLVVGSVYLAGLVRPKLVDVN